MNTVDFELNGEKDLYENIKLELNRGTNDDETFHHCNFHFQIVQRS